MFFCIASINSIRFNSRIFISCFAIFLIMLICFCSILRIYIIEIILISLLYKLYNAPIRTITTIIIRIINKIFKNQFSECLKPHISNKIRANANAIINIALNGSSPSFVKIHLTPSLNPQIIFAIILRTFELDLLKKLMQAELAC